MHFIVYYYTIIIKLKETGFIFPINKVMFWLNCWSSGGMRQKIDVDVKNTVCKQL